MKWDVPYRRAAKLPAYIEADSFDELEAKVRAIAPPNRELRFEGYTDQLDVFIKRPNNNRFDRFMTLMTGD